jgi:hypothetical protein
MSELVRYCNKCGAKLIDKAAVCVKCGHRVPSANFRAASSVSNRNNSKKTNPNVILGIYGFSGALGVFCALVPAIGAIIIGICFNLIYAGILLIIAGGIYLLVERGFFGWAFIIVGILAAIFIAFYRFGLIGDLTAYIQKIKTFSY